MLPSRLAALSIPVCLMNLVAGGASAQNFPVKPVYLFTTGAGGGAETTRRRAGDS